MNTYQLKEDLKSITDKDEWELVRIIVASAYCKFVKKTLNKRPDFNVGDNVSFSYSRKRYYGKKIGTIVKMNPKRAKIDVKVGKPEGIWNVPYNLICKASKEDLVQLSVTNMLINEK